MSRADRHSAETRRWFLGRLLAGTAAPVLAACSTTERSATMGSTATVGPTTLPPPGTSTPPQSSSTTVPLPALSQPSTVTTAPEVTRTGWVARENELPGTDSWRITSTTAPVRRGREPGAIEGYADRTSAQPGDTVTLHVATSADGWWAEVYRMGWYGGKQARLVWLSEPQPASWQWMTESDPETRMVRAKWTPRLTFTVGDDWPAGAYLVKLSTSVGTASYVPLTVRRDDASASLVFVSAVTTWQAYNPWGGRSLYKDFETGRESDRSKVVSFDRPYALAYQWGSADFLTHELPLLSLIEEMGLDCAYATSIDLHLAGLDAAATDTFLRGRTAVLSPGHDEYYSRGMRRTLEQARKRGINLAFFGANAVYRHVRLEPDAEGLPFRQMANYRIASRDPMADDNPAVATVQWRNPPLRNPENSLVGVQYFAAGVDEPMVIVDPEAWCFAGVDFGGSRYLRNLITVEADGLGPKASEPASLQVLASSPVAYRGATYRHAMTYYSTARGGGVFATGTIGWVFALDGPRWGDVRVTAVVRGVTANVLRAFATGPAGLAHPSVPTASRYRTSVQPG